MTRFVLGLKSGTMQLENQHIPLLTKLWTSLGQCWLAVGSTHHCWLPSLGWEGGSALSFYGTSSKSRQRGPWQLPDTQGFLGKLLL